MTKTQFEKEALRKLMYESDDSTFKVTRFHSGYLMTRGEIEELLNKSILVYYKDEFEQSDSCFVIHTQDRGCFKVYVQKPEKDWDAIGEENELREELDRIDAWRAERGLDI